MCDQKAKMSPRWQIMETKKLEVSLSSRNPISHPGFLGENALGGEAEPQPAACSEATL